MSEFTEELKWLRISSAATQYDFARAMGISIPQYSAVENGRKQPSVDFVDHLCAFFTMPASDARYWHALGARANGWRL